MKKIKIIAGIAWAFAGLILIIILFPGLNGFSASASRLPFMKINANYSGGEVVKQLTSDGCTLSVHRPVFEGLIGERKNGFVQIDWRGTIPEIIMDTIDFDFDGVPDFTVSIDRKEEKSELVALSPFIKNLGTSTQTSFGWAIRVELERASGNKKSNK
jgi:hypothetical protein